MKQKELIKRLKKSNNYLAFSNFYLQKRRFFQIYWALEPFLKSAADFATILQIELTFFTILKVNLKELEVFIKTLIKPELKDAAWEDFLKSLSYRFANISEEIKPSLIKSALWIKNTEKKNYHLHRFMESLIALDLNNNYYYRKFLNAFNY